jgi:hypothetical protein
VAFNPDFDPFVASNCWVTNEAHVRVERSVPLGQQQPIARFTKTFLRRAEKDYSWFNTHECELLMSFKSLHLARVVQVGALHWDGPSTFDRVETLDAGPSLMDWLRISPIAQDGNSCAHPLATPAAFLLLVRGLMLALHEVHSAGFVHCDLREANVCLAFGKHPTKTGVITPDWNGIKLIDFAFSLSKNHPLREPLPIDPRPHLHSAAFIDALGSDDHSGQARRVSKLDWRIDLFAMGTMVQRMFENLRPQWPTEPLHIVNEVESVVKRLIADLKSQDFSPKVAPDLQTHKRLLQPVDGALVNMGTAPTPAFIVKGLAQSGAGCLDSTDAVRPTPLVNGPAAPTPLVPPHAQPRAPQAPVPRPIPSSSVQPSPVPNALPPPARVALPVSPRSGVVSALWQKLLDSLVLERNRSAAAKGNAAAAYKVGTVILRGYATKQDPALALQWFLVAAQQGHAAAQAMAGTMYDGGHGTTREDALAVHWYGQAAAQGNATGHYGLGVLLTQGRGIRQDDSAAVEHLRFAAAADQPEAYTALGQLILAGRGAVRSRDDAIECFRRAADLGDGTAAQFLGQLYEKPNTGELPNPVESLRWYRRAVKLGRLDASGDVQRIAKMFPQ